MDILLMLLKGHRVIHRKLQSLHGGLIEITLTFPLIISLRLKK